MASLRELSTEQRWDSIRALCRADLFFLLTYILRRPDLNHDWLFERCREVQAEPDNVLDLWAREHGKSSIITFGLTVQDILASHGRRPTKFPEVTVGIFSHTRPIAKGFLRQIMQEFEQNVDLKRLFPDVLWAEPKKQAPKWSEDDGIIVRRVSNPKEATVEAWGLVDGQPTAKHFRLRVYDDTVTKESVNTPEMIQKTTSAWEHSLNLAANDGPARYTGTIYAQFDTYRTMQDRGIQARIYPATKDGTDKFTPENCVLMSPETLAKKRKEMGPNTFCFPAGTPVLMADWTERAIEDIKPGEWVVGYDFPKGAKSSLVRSQVKRVGARIANVIEAHFESGRVVRCTDDHKWYTGRRGCDVGGNDTHHAYLPLGFGRFNVKGLISVYDPRAIHIGGGTHEAGWLSGIFDGEGAVSGATIHIHQSLAHNPQVCARIESVLTSLGFDYGKHVRGSGLGPGGRARAGQDHRAARNGSNRMCAQYYLRGGRQERIRFLNICRPAKAEKIVDQLFEQGTREFGKACKDKLIAIKHLGPQQVFNIETETGNYVAWGYATKNSTQMLLNPKGGVITGFNEKWLRYWPRAEFANLNWIILGDPASGKRGDPKKKVTSDYTAIWVLGLGADDNWYVGDYIHDRLNLKQRVTTVFALHRRWKPKFVGWEEYGLQADIEAMQWEMDRRNYRFQITPLGGALKKEDRILRLQPVFENARIYLPEGGCVHTNYEGVAVDTIRQFITDEYTAFPVVQHDDGLDCLSRIEDEEVKTNVSPPAGAAPEKSRFMSEIMQDHLSNQAGSSWQAR